MSILGAAACGGWSSNTAGAPASDTAPAPSTRKYLLERVGDAAVVQLYADGFRDLPLAAKTLIWHLYQAAIAGRDFVTPDDIKTMTVPVLEHRLILRPEFEIEGLSVAEVIERILQEIAVPR